MVSIAQHSAFSRIGDERILAISSGGFGAEITHNSVQRRLSTARIGIRRIFD